MIPPGFIQDLLTRTDIVGVVGRHVELKKAGINYKGLCPFHGEKTPSFIVSPSRQTYHCFGCGAHGDALRFLVEHHGLGFIEAVKDLAQEAGMQVPEEDISPQQKAQAAQRREQQLGLVDLLERAADHYRGQLKASPRAIAYLKGRGLTGAIAARFGLGYAPEGWRTLAGVFPRYDEPALVEAGLVIVQGEDEAQQKRYDRFRDRIMFPIRNVKGQTIAFGGRVLDKGEPKYLNSPETPVFIKGHELYGLYEARPALRARGYVLVTEGYMDVVALAQLGFENAVATLGTACTAEHVHTLLRFTEQVVFSFDGDAAGRRAAGRALEAALPHASDTRSFRFLFLPTEHDPDSFIRAYGPEAFEAQVRDAVPLSRQLLDHAAAECDLSSAEGRARMLAQARPLWQSLPDGALRAQLLAELALRGGLPAAELSRLWAAAAAPRHAGRPTAAAARDERTDTAEAADAYSASGSAGSGRRNGTPRSWESRGGRGRWTSRPDDDGLPRPTGRRLPPRRPEDRLLQMLFGEPSWWDSLGPDEQELLHQLPAPHGELIAWLERDLAEHGARPWAVLREALRSDPLIDAGARALADADADPGATPADLRRAMDTLLVRELGERLQALAAEAAQRPGALQEYRQIEPRWKEAKDRLAASPSAEV